MNFSSQNILIVDDDLQFRVSLRKTFLKEGYNVNTVPDGQEALKVIRNSFYNLIITDQRIPGISGLELLYEIKKISPKSKVILITAYGDTALYRRVKDAGAFGYLDKPIKREVILSLAGDALNSSTLQQ